jgi:four helix bundle protein
MSYEEWVESVPPEIKGDALWRVEAYRLALFAAEMGWHDVTKLVGDQRTRSLSDQLYRALGSISANIAEGYSRGTGKDRARFYEYALGSARESRDWYYKAHHVLGDSVAQHRLGLLTQIIRLLLTIVPQQRGYAVREARLPYQDDVAYVQPESLAEFEALAGLLKNVPLP